MKRQANNNVTSNEDDNTLKLTSYRIPMLSRKGPKQPIESNNHQFKMETSGIHSSANASKLVNHHCVMPSSSLSSTEYIFNVPKIVASKQFFIARFAESCAIDFAAASRGLPALNNNEPKIKDEVETNILSTKLGVHKFGPLSSTIVITRENNFREYKTSHNMSDAPKTGAGTEYRRDQKEEAHRRKLGYARRVYNPYIQPWLLTVQQQTPVEQNSKALSRKYKGVKEGGIVDMACFYVFIPTSNSSFDIYPVPAWFTFNPVIGYQFLGADEAEAEFNKREKTFDYFNVMLQHRMQVAKDEEEGLVDAQRDVLGGAVCTGKTQGFDLSGKGVTNRTIASAKSKYNQSNNTLQVTDMDNVKSNGGGGGLSGEGGSDNDMGDDEEGDDATENAKKKKTGGTASGGKKGGGKQKKESCSRRRRKRNELDASDNDDDPDKEFKDDSDLDDHDGDEVDYMTHSSAEDEDNLAEEEREALYAEKGVAEEGGLRGLISDHGSSDEEEEDKEDNTNNAADKDNEKQKTKDKKSHHKNKKKRSSKTTNNNNNNKKLKLDPDLEHNSDFSDNNSNSDDDNNNQKSSSSSSSSSADEDDDSSDDISSQEEMLDKRICNIKRQSSTNTTGMPNFSLNGASDKKQRDINDNSGKIGSSPPLFLYNNQSTSLLNTTSSLLTAVTSVSSVNRASINTATASTSSTSSRIGETSRILESAARKYLTRKPMLVQDLVKKCKSKCPQLSANELGKEIALVLKRIGVDKSKVGSVVMLSLKS